MRTVLLPVKDFSDAKQRLVPALDAETRASLAEAMLRDVLRALSTARTPERIIVLTASERVVEVVRPFGFEILHESAVEGHSAAVNRATRHLCPDARSILALASDLPTLSPADVDQVFDAALPGMCIVASRDGTGTNAVHFTAPARIDMEYGDDSLKRHLARARAAGLQVQQLRIPGIEFDVDTPEDLRRLLDLKPNTSEAWRYIHSHPPSRTVSL